MLMCGSPTLRFRFDATVSPFSLVLAHKRPSRSQNSVEYRRRPHWLLAR